MEHQPRRSPLKRKEFLEISSKIKACRKLGIYNAARLAKESSVSQETIRAVRRAGTWPQWERDKEARRKRALARPRLIAAVRPGPVKPNFFSRLLRRAR